MEIEPNLDELEGVLGYTFKNRDLLLEALTHPHQDVKSYQRLEFVGDRVINLIIADKLFEAYTSASEGSLDAIHASCCGNYRLAESARRINLAKYIRIHQSGEEAVKLRSNPLILASVFEALASAMFLDSGRDYNAVRQVLDQHLFYNLQRIAHNSRKEPSVERLQRLSETKLRLQTRFVCKELEGSRDNQFRAIVFIGDVQVGKSYGPNETIAKNKAAREVIRKTNQLTGNLPTALLEKIQQTSP